MIAREWIGETLASNADEYLRCLEETPLTIAGEPKGTRRCGFSDKARFVFLSRWDSLEPIKAFAGAEYEKAVYDPGDTKFLLYLDPHASHYEVLVSPDTGA